MATKKQNVKKDHITEVKVTKYLDSKGSEFDKKDQAICSTCINYISDLRDSDSTDELDMGIWIVNNADKIKYIQENVPLIKNLSDEVTNIRDVNGY